MVKKGVVRISNGPKFMQLPAGFFTEMGIVPVGPIKKCARSWRAYTRGVRVLTLPGLGHGGWLLDPSAMRNIADRVRGLCS